MNIFMTVFSSVLALRFLADFTKSTNADCLQALWSKLHSLGSVLLRLFMYLSLLTAILLLLKFSASIACIMAWYSFCCSWFFSAHVRLAVYFSIFAICWALSHGNFCCLVGALVWVELWDRPLFQPPVQTPNHVPNQLLNHVENMLFIGIRYCLNM